MTHRALPSATQAWASRLCLASSMALAGVYVALSKPLLVVFPVLLLAWLRFLIAAVVMAPWLRRSPDEAPMDWGTHRLVFLQSFLGNFLFSICMLGGMQQASAASAGVIMASIPAVVAVLSWRVLGEQISLQVAAGITLGVGGIALLARVSWGVPADAVRDTTTTGLALLLVAVICEAAYAVIAKRLSGRLGPRRVSALINLWGLVLMTPFGLFQARTFDFAAVSPAHWALLTFYAVAASSVAVWLWMTGIRHVPAAQSGVFTAMLPISTTLVGVLAFGEQLGTLHWLAFGLAMCGVLLATWPRTRAQ